MKEFIELIKRIWFVILILGFTVAMAIMAMTA